LAIGLCDEYSCFGSAAVQFNTGKNDPETLRGRLQWTILSDFAAKAKSIYRISTDGHRRSAGFQTCRIAGFQTGRRRQPNPPATARKSPSPKLDAHWNHEPPVPHAVTQPALSAVSPTGSRQGVASQLPHEQPDVGS